MARPSFDDDGPDGDRQFVMRPAFAPLTRAVKVLMLANVAVYLAMFALSFASEAVYWRAVHYLGIDPELWRQGAPLVPVWQLASYGFLHSLDPWHIVMNLASLYFFGVMLEQELGPRRFVITYFAAQVFGGLCFLALSLATGGAVPLIGASGACFGVMVAAAVLWPSRPTILYFIPLTLRTLALIFVGIEVFSFLLSLKAGALDGVSHVTHLGGAIYGFVAVRTGLIHWDPVRKLAQHRAERAVQQAENQEQRMDQLLEKIHREGMSSLSRSEREFLKRVSSRR